MEPVDDPLTAIDIWDVALRLCAAVLVGVLIGIDRERLGKPVGIRTLALVSLGAALVSLSTVHLEALQNQPDAISRVVQGVIQGVMAGIGFIGAGAILHRDKVHGLTTAATVWVTIVFGVRVRPFSAHCWAEWRGVALNDRYGHAHAYQPILRVAP